jgi:hypothetical protein
VPDSIDPVERKNAISQLELHVAVSMQGRRISEAELWETLQTFNSIGKPPLPESDLEKVARRLNERLAVDVDLGSVITSRDYEPWLDGRRRDIDWGRWLAYKTMLIQQRRAPAVIDTTDQLTNEILDLAGDPTKPGAWGRRGLVLGDVQSGKTGTYLGLFNKAADAGYRLFILLAGNTEVLRQQTQARVDEAFIGRDTSVGVPRKGAKVTRKHIGVGLIRKDLAQASGMTTVLQDFSRKSYEAASIAIQTNAAHPYVFVVKKNKHILEALIAWLKEQADASGGMLSVPVMILDDESDYASINTKSETDPTTINQLIRDVLALFTRSSDVAFTATPFANIFIDHGVENDLFPRDFVYSLDAPTNYVGSAKTFGTTEDVKTDGLTDLDDIEEFIPLGHKSSLQVNGLPKSLYDAMDTFLLSNAIRDLRGEADQPRSMLVNVSRFKAVQRQVFDLVRQAVAETKTAVELHYAVPETEHSVILRLQRRFVATYATADVTWPEVLEELPMAISDVRVRLFNSDTDKRLTETEEQWDRPARMIAVGGDVLSRGLTLEGLCVSYFYRRVMASDTLMQMARWFGYRDGYQDLCRIWINAESADNYRFATDSIEELRTDLRLMRRQELTPEDFGIAVRKHPGALLITARSKMKNTEQVSGTISLTGRRLETTTLLRDHAQNRADLNWLVETIDTVSEYVPTASRWHRWLSVDKVIVAEFLKRYGEWAPHSDLIFSRDTLSKWVRSATAAKFARWDIAVANGRSGADIISLGRTPKRKLPLPQRVLRNAGGLLHVSGSSRRLAGPTDLVGLLDPRAREKAEAEHQANEPGKSPSEIIYYPYLERPALIVYPLGSKKPDDGEGSEEQHDVPIGPEDYLVALKVAIPGDTINVRNGEGDVTYVINTVAQQYWLSEFADVGDEDLDD